MFLSLFLLWAMRLRRSVSNIVAVILLIVIAVAVVTVLYMWLSGVISLVYTNLRSSMSRLR